MSRIRDACLFCCCLSWLLPSWGCGEVDDGRPKPVRVVGTVLHNGEPVEEA